MKIVILSIFPEIFSGFLKSSLIEKAIAKGHIGVEAIDIRQFAALPNRQVDDSPYGGGAGMVLKPEPLTAAIEAAKKKLPFAKVILLSAAGRLFTQSYASALSNCKEMILVCGRYEGVDERVIESLIDIELSVGNYVLMGGEVAAMIVVEATTRLIKDVLGNSESLKEESFAVDYESGTLLEGPHYTKPAEFNGMKVPDVLTSGDHQKIAAWRREKAIAKTALNRPELLKNKLA